jgi:hypothetical protein
MSLGRGPKGERLYRCRAKHASGDCPSPASVLADVVEPHVEELVMAEIDGVTRLVPDSEERDRAASELARARADLDGFRADRDARRKLGAEWHDWLDDYLRAVNQAKAELDRLDMRVNTAMEGLTRDHYSALASGDRREVLGGFIDAVMVRRSRGRGRNVDPLPSRARVLWRGEGPADLPRRRVVNPIVSFDFEERVEAGVVSSQDSA